MPVYLWAYFKRLLNRLRFRPIVSQLSLTVGHRVGGEGGMGPIHALGRPYDPNNAHSGLPLLGQACQPFPPRYVIAERPENCFITGFFGVWGRGLSPPSGGVFFPPSPQPLLHKLVFRREKITLVKRKVRPNLGLDETAADGEFLACPRRNVGAGGPWQDPGSPRRRGARIR